jgi:uncharacterized oxidoreductase
MNLGGNTVLVTGGSNGIGFAIAKRFVVAGSRVIVCGRREELLWRAKEQCPQLETIVCDVGLENERIKLFEALRKGYPDLNILVNNAGIQNRPPHLWEDQDWKSHHQEIAINLEAPIHLSMLFLPHLLKQSKATILNISSGLAFSPIAMMSTYCATKAALHSFTLSLRHQLRDTSVGVVEIVPPAVNTDLGGKGLHDFGAPVDSFADSIMARIQKGELEVGFEFSEKVRRASRDELDQVFSQMNRQWDL